MTREREIWFRYRRMALGLLWWPCHWKGVALYCLAGATAYASYVGWERWFAPSYDFGLWIVFGLIFTIILLVTIDRSEIADGS